MNAVVSDTSPLHYLIECDAIHILPGLFGQVIIPPAVNRELQHPETPRKTRDWMLGKPSWLKVQAPGRLDPNLNLDDGELEAICLARQIGAAIILMDDQKGRATARRLGLPVAGTIGLLDQAASRGLVDLVQVVARLRQTNARLPEDLLQSLLKQHRRG